MQTVAKHLKDRAESYGRDGSILRRDGETDKALIYETVADELRRCAASLEDGVFLTTDEYNELVTGFTMNEVR